jgi:plasmid maintenance system antidote protein VapI
MTIYIASILKSKDLNVVSKGTDLTPARLKLIVSGEPMSVGEAVSIANYLDMDAQVLLNKQTEEQLVSMNYTKPSNKASKRDGEVRAKSPNVSRVRSVDESSGTF